MVLALVSMMHSITSLPEEFRTAIEIVSLCTSIPICFTLSIDRVLLSGGVRAEHSKPYSKRGALLYCVLINGQTGSYPHMDRIGPEKSCYRNVALRFETLYFGLG